MARDVMAEKKKALSTDEKTSIVEECRDRIEQSYETDRSNREEAATDLAFLAGDQWPEVVKEQRNKQKRPMLTINRLPQFVRQITNDIRQAELSIKVVPEEDDDIILAKIFDELIQNIQYQSSAKHVFSIASEHQASCGIGHFRIVTEYSKTNAFNQEIRIKLINNPLSVYWDPGAVEPDRSDAMWCCVTEMLPLKTFKTRFPKAGTDEMPVPSDGSGSRIFWRTDDTVRVCEYWRKVPYTKRMALLESGETIDITKMGEAEAGQLPIVRTRDQECYKVEHFLVSGADVLEGPHEWAGQYIPIVPVIGGEFPLESKTYRYSSIRFARDPQQLYNFYRTATAEAIALQPKAPFTATAKMIGPFKAMWDQANVNHSPYLLYQPDPDAPGAKPEREPPPAFPAALVNEAQFAAEDMKGTTGIYDAALGAKSNETSGVAIGRRQIEADTANYHFIDNLQRSLEYTGRILVDLIPKIYDNERVMRLKGNAMQADQQVSINKVVMGIDGMPVIINDLSAADFDVRVTIGKSYTTKRAESAAQMLELMRNMPPEAQLALGYLAVKNLDLVDLDEAKKIFKNLVPPQLMQDPDNPAPPPPPDPRQEAAADAELGKMQGDAEKAAQDARKTAAEADRLEIENMIGMALPSPDQQLAQQPTGPAQDSFYQ